MEIFLNFNADHIDSSVTHKNNWKMQKRAHFQSKLVKKLVF